MNAHLSALDDTERAAAIAAVAFFKGRLESRSSIEWAIALRPEDRVKKTALTHLLFVEGGEKLAEPWRSAWRLIEESWSTPLPSHDESILAIRVKERVLAGERSGSLIDLIVKLVSPQLKLEPRRAADSNATKKRRPKLEELFRASLGSPSLVTFEQLGLREVQDARFLTELALSINFAVENGLSIGKRIGWNGVNRLWRLGFLYRVDYVPRRGDAGGDIDEFHEGIAPAVKLLNATVQHVARYEPEVGYRFARRWIGAGDPIQLRLWAAVSRDGGITPSDDIGRALLGVPSRVFWNLHDFPEVAELRAVRFDDLLPAAQAKVLGRVRSGPPASTWPKGTLADDVARYRKYWIARELRRIEVAGGRLPEADQQWLREALAESPDLARMNSLDEGFLEAGTASWVAPSPDRQYDFLEGAARLEALEAALGASRTSWDNDPSERANDWIREGTNASSVLADLGANRDRADQFPHVIERLGWSHNPRQVEDGEQAIANEAEIFLAIVVELSEEVLEKAIEGITFWLSTWEDFVVRFAGFDRAWNKLWPLAVRATNAVSTASDTPVLDVVGRADNDEDRTPLDTLNTPVGRLVGVFLSSCPSVNAGDANPFESPPLSQMRNDLVSAPGRSGLIAKHRLIEGLHYFLHTDEAWARQHLIVPLEANDSTALALWRAIARRTQFKFVLLHIGNQMAEMSADLRLGRETRSSLLSSLVLEPLHANLADREPVVSIARVQQAVRTVEDEVRARAANMVTRFLKEVGKGQGDDEAVTPELVFRKAVSPFLQTVWPQERSLATPGVSAAWADLPAASYGAFADAVQAVEGFLVPFNCWSMSDYGFWPSKNDLPNLHLIDNAEKASALLRLLDATVGSAEGATVPYDLPVALRRLSDVSPELTLAPSFKRLSAAARMR